MTTTQQRPVDAGTPDDQPDWTLNRPVFFTAAGCASAPPAELMTLFLWSFL